MKHVDLFSGIGGFALAARNCGIETIQFVEIDKFCHKVLRKNFPGVPIHEDIKTFTYSEHNGRHVPEVSGGFTETSYNNSQGEIETGEFKRGNRPAICGNLCRKPKERPFLVTGGFPCQPYSCAGKQRGAEDDRALWPEMLRIISEARPTWVIGENVGGFINMGLDSCISDLETEGYTVQPFVIPACAVGAPHRRDRVWIVANSGNTGTRSLRQQRKDTISGLEQILWSKNWIEIAARLCGVDDGVPRGMDRSKRLKALGNAIVPQIAEEIMRSIIKIGGVR